MEKKKSGLKSPEKPLIWCSCKTKLTVAMSEMFVRQQSSTTEDFSSTSSLPALPPSLFHRRPRGSFLIFQPQSLKNSALFIEQLHKLAYIFTPPHKNLFCCLNSQTSQLFFVTNHRRPVPCPLLPPSLCLKFPFIQSPQWCQKCRAH